MSKFFSHSDPPSEDPGAPEPPIAPEHELVDGGEAEEEEGPPTFVTNLAPIENQVGTHVIAALQHPETVAVLTTVAQGADGHQRVVSVGLDPAIVNEVQRMLNEADESRTHRAPCVGFHCWVEDRDGDGVPDREQE